jgi:purine-binding chemotaxis protein CheW
MNQDQVIEDTFGVGVNESESTSLVATFLFGNEIYGVNALKVQEIVRFQKMTPVPQSPNYILGLINLRGQIVTAIDLKYRLTGKHVQISDNSMNLILNTEHGTCSVIVDEVGDVMEITESQQEIPPETMSAELKKYVVKICKLENVLLSILDSEMIARKE